MRFRSLLPAALIAFAGAFAPASIAQDKPATPETPAVQDRPAAQEKPIEQEKPAAQDKPAAQVQQIDPQVKQAARALIEELLKVSHAEEIFGDLRRTLREVYIPGVRDFVMGNTPGVAAPDPKSAAAAAKVLTLMDYARRGGDELDVALSENREAMISDVAEQMAKSAKSTDIDDVRATLKLPAVTKGLDALYAISKLLTGFTYEDSRTFSSFSAWASRQNLDAAEEPPRLAAAYSRNAARRGRGAVQAQDHQGPSACERSAPGLAYRRDGGGRAPLRARRLRRDGAHVRERA